MQLLDFNNFINEARSASDFNPKLDRAADIVASFINKKTGLDFKKFPFTVFYTVDYL
jgi:hypothetical protein